MIGPFKGKYSFLSNFYRCNIVTKRGTTLRSVEHGFQACKTRNPIEQMLVLSASTPSEAKHVGLRVTLRPDWEQVKVGVMYHLVLWKFEQNEDLAQKLLATGDEELVEVNTWGDRFWGVCGGRGKNHLGRILMQVRNELGSRVC